MNGIQVERVWLLATSKTYSKLVKERRFDENERDIPLQIGNHEIKVAIDAPRSVPLVRSELAIKPSGWELACQYRQWISAVESPDV